MEQDKAEEQLEENGKEESPGENKAEGELEIQIEKWEDLESDKKEEEPVE